MLIFVVGQEDHLGIHRTEKLVTGGGKLVSSSMGCHSCAGIEGLGRDSQSAMAILSFQRALVVPLVDFILCHVADMRLIN